MTNLYWGLEFAKVLLCYSFVLFIWPSVIFRKYLHGKSKIFRFCFCAVTQLVLINTVVIVLGLMHLLNAWVVNILFYGSLLFSVRKLLIPTPTLKRDLRKIMTGTLSWRGFLSARFVRFAAWLRKLIKNLWRQIRPHLLEYIMLTAILAYGVMYFSYSPFVDHSYGFGDMYTHHSWIYGLIQGQVFSAGVYPEGMHCVVYLMHTVTGFAVYSCNLFIGCINVFVILLSAYCLMREIFHWRGTPLLVLTVFLVVAVNSMDMVISMARLQRSLPGEYGLYTVYLCALFLLRFLKEEFPKGWQKKPKNWLKNENLLLFSMSLAASIAIHFYVTITAFFVCLPFAIIYIGKVLSKKRFVPLIAAVMCGVMIAALPMGGALLSGIPFQGSISWALSVMDGEDAEEQEANQTESESAEAVSQTAQAEIEQVQEAPANTGIADTLREKADALYQKYCRLLGDTIAFWIMRISVLSAIFCLIYRLFCMVFRRLRPLAGEFDNYLPIIAASLFIMIMYAAPDLGIPELIACIRLPSTAYLLLLMVAAIPIDILFSALQRFGPNWLSQTVSLIGVTSICVATIMTGNYHGYFYNELTRYRSVVNVTNSIVQSFPEYNYTVVSSTDDLYSIVQYGRHEELVEFLKTIEKGKEYYIPTEYIFIYVEKHPIEHAQYHYSSGPDWLATDVYADTNVLHTRTSKYPEIFASQISDEDAKRSVLDYPTEYSSYRDIDSRTVINSKADKWCRDFADMYDNEMKIYYEDDDFICYYFRQNTFSLYDLSIWNK